MNRYVYPSMELKRENMQKLNREKTSQQTQKIYAMPTYVTIFKRCKIGANSIFTTFSNARKCPFCAGFPSLIILTASVAVADKKYSNHLFKTP